jgi:hypothetical protein
MDSVRDLPRGRGCPIRRSRDQRSLASPPGFSQRATSFIASWRQGIHQMPLTISLDRSTRRSQGQAPTSHEPRSADDVSANAAHGRYSFSPEEPPPRNRQPTTAQHGSLSHSLFTCQRSNAPKPQPKGKLTLSFPDPRRGSRRGDRRQRRPCAAKAVILLRRKRPPPQKS